MTWDISATLNLIQARYGRLQREAANHCFQSVHQRLRYGRFHYTALKKDFDAFKEAKIGDRMVIDLAWSADDGERGEYLEFMDRVGAHAVACVQSIHAVADLLATSVYVSLNLNANGKPVDEHSITFQLTLDRLALNSRHATAANLLNKLRTHPSFQHVDALSNKAKHSGMIRPTMNEDWTGTRAERIQIHFEGFMRKSTRYPSVAIIDVLGPAYEQVSKVTVDLGNELTQLLT